MNQDQFVFWLGSHRHSRKVGACQDVQRSSGLADKNDACFVRYTYLGGLPGRGLRETGLPPPGYKATYIRTSLPITWTLQLILPWGMERLSWVKASLLQELSDGQNSVKSPLDQNWKKSNWTWRSPLAVTVWTTPCPGSTAVALKDLQQDHQRWRCSTWEAMNCTAVALNDLQQIMENAFNKWF